MKRPTTLGDFLRAAVLATPLIASTGCPGFLGNCGDPITDTFDLSQVSDGGVAFLRDGGVDDGGCFAACASAEFRPVIDSCELTALPDGGAGLSCTVPKDCTGRRTRGLLAARPGGSRCAVGRHFAEMARLEHAAVRAFRVLAGELAAHRAPGSLVRAARRSMREETRHVRLTSELARRHGAVPQRARFTHGTNVRPLEAVAEENAVEGCVRETYGAAVGLWQSLHAQDASVARAMAEIAHDEVRHAELSWAIDQWIAPRLSRAARLRVGEAKATMLSALSAAVRAPVDPVLVRRGGVPSAESAAALLARVTNVAG